MNLGHSLIDLLDHSDGMYSDEEWQGKLSCPQRMYYRKIPIYIRSV